MGKKSDHIAKLANAAERLAEKGDAKSVEVAREVINKHLDDIKDEAERNKK